MVNCSFLDAFKPMAPASNPAAAEELSRILSTPPPVDPQAYRGDVRLTTRFSHGAVCGQVLPMNEHVVMTYYGASQLYAWRDGRRRSNGVKRPGMMTFIPRGHEAHWEVAGNVEVSHVYLSDAQLQSCAATLGSDLQDLQFEDRISFDDPVASHLLQVLAHEAENPLEHSRLFADQAIELLCLHLVRSHIAAGMQPVRDILPGLQAWQLRRLREYVHERLDQDLQLEELAAVVGLSRFHFCVAFKRAAGQSPHAWIVHLRMEKARELLAAQRLSIYQVALEVGYQTPSAFASAFRKTQGMTPSAFRAVIRPALSGPRRS
jgi:AraC family transcriptional regulator